MGKQKKVIDSDIPVKVEGSWERGKFYADTI